MKLTPTAYVILGMLSWRPMSGYDIKGIVDNSTRFFWAASYGQIYPELRKLAQEGLVEADQAEGNRRRVAYRLTPAGRKELRRWLTHEPETFEMRDEGLLKLFFAAAAPQTAIGSLRAKARHHAQTAEQLRAIEAGGRPQGFTHEVLRYGIECHGWMAKWCERAVEDLQRGESEVAV